jgi:signal transduction histidine kinase
MMLFKKAKSVRRTLLALLLPAGIALMALAWLVHGLLLDRMSMAFVESRLQDEVAFLEHQIRQADGKIDTLRTGDYFEEVFHHAFAIQAPDQTIISPQSWVPLLKPLIQTAQQGAIRITGQSGPGTPRDVLAFRQLLRVNSQPIVIIVAEDMEALKNSQAELHAWTAIVSIVLILMLTGVIWVGITLAMRPVVSLQGALKKLQAGENSRIDVRTPEEFQPLVRQLNQVLDTLDQRLERSREALANLSHSVKTPIAAVRQLLEDTDRPLEVDLRHEMATRLGDIDKQLEAEMRRSRFAGPQAGKSAYPVKQARDLLWMLGRLYPEKSFELSTELTEERRWPIEEHDLNELLGNLLDNAGKWSSGGVELSLNEDDGQLMIVVSDDGPGVADNALDQLGKRGLRLDEQTPGHGLGLAIVRDIVQRYEGRLRFSRRPANGLKVDIAIRHPGRHDE